MWERDPSLVDEIKKAWNSSNVQGPGLDRVVHKLKRVQQDLQGWSKRKFRSVRYKVQKLQQKLDKLWDMAPSNRRDMQIHECSKELDEYLYREEMLWRQRSRVTSIREGEQNTKYFQRKATWR